MLKRTARKGGKRIILGWNRGLGDIALGLYAMVQRIRELIPDADITFLTRENLLEGFSLLEGVKAIAIPGWKRGESASVKEAARQLGLHYDLLIEKPSPTDWVYWQHGKVTPRLKWNPKQDVLYEKFALPGDSVGVQVVAETNYGLWRNWPRERWEELFRRFPQVKFLLFGYGETPKFSQENVIDLRGKTTLFELLSIIKHRCSALILPDSGISSMVYYLDASFPIRLITLWADPHHGILKQGVASPNPQLVHCPVVGERRDLATVSVDAVATQLFPQRTGCILLAGGQGSRLGHSGPKGLFSIAGKTLFQWACEKVPKGAPIAVMTSPLNHEETVAFFQKNDHFGLDVHFFTQEMAPFLDDERRVLPQQGPNGNGSVFRSFEKAGLADLFAKKGVELLSVFHVENPLADPYDSALLQTARQEKAEVTIRCIERTGEHRSMGALVEKGDKIEIVEYTELDSSREYKYAYSGQLVFDLKFFRKMADAALPLHWVRKQVGEQWVWKGEQFIFDVLPFASRVRAVCAPSESSYAPLKSKEHISQIEKRML